MLKNTVRHRRHQQILGHRRAATLVIVSHGKVMEFDINCEACIFLTFQLLEVICTLLMTVN